MSSARQVFVHLETGEIQELSHSFLRPDRMAALVDGRYYYFAELEGVAVLVHESASEALLIETGIELGSSSAQVKAEEDWQWLYLDGAPVWRYSAKEERKEELPTLELGEGERYEETTSDPFLLLSVGGEPRYQLNLKNSELIAYSNFESELQFTERILAKGQWFAGVGLSGPTWRIDADSGRAESLDMRDYLSDFVTWPLLDCSRDPATFASTGPVQLFADGSFGLSLRRESRAGYFLGSFDLSSWEPLGGPFADVDEMGAISYPGGRWIVWGMSSPEGGLYCPPEGQIPFSLDAAPEQLAVGNSVRLISSEGKHSFTAQGHPSEFHFSPEGSCVARGRALYDLEQGTEVDLGFNVRSWLGESQ